MIQRGDVMREYVREEVGKRILEARRKCGYSRERLSELADINAKYIYEIEYGLKVPSAEKLYNISQALKEPMNNLVIGENKNEKTATILSLINDLSDSDIERVTDIIRIMFDI